MYQKNPHSFEDAVAEVKKLPASVSRSDEFIKVIKMAGSDDDGNYPQGIQELIERWEREVLASKKLTP